MEKKHQVSAEQAIDMVMGWLDKIEVKGYANVRALSQSMDLLAKVKEFLHEETKAPDPEPVVTIEPVEQADEN